jgi:post-segregation antitoxin (ccd killing protein)
MRSPEEKFISEKQWQELKRVLARVGVDADSVQIKQLPLRVELDRLAEQSIERSQKILTTRQLQCTVDEAIAEIARFRDVFGPRSVATCYAGDELAAEARAVLDRLETELRSANPEGRDAPEIVQTDTGLRLQPGDGPSRNASKEARNSYWRRLADVWRTIVPPQTPRQRQIDFVVACTGASRSAVRSYFDRKRASK